MANVIGALRTHAPAHVSLTARISEAWTDYMARRRKRDQILRELSAYTDRELADLGFCRSDIPAVANGSYRR